MRKTPGTVRRLRTGGWMADVTINGRRRQLRAPTKAAAQERLLEALAGAGGNAACPGHGGHFSLAQARELTIRSRWAGTSWERTAAIYSKTVVEFFGSRTPLVSVRAPEVERLRRPLLAKGLRPSTVNRHVAVLSAMGKQAALHGHIPEAPTMPPQLREVGHRDRVLEEEEVRGFCRVFEQLGQPEAADLLLFLLATACRWSEAERLTGDRVDRRRRTVTFTATKNGGSRTVPLTSRGWQAIEPHLPAVPRHRVWSYGYNQFRRLWEEAKAALGLADDQALVPHCTRHTAATRLAQSGVSLAQIQAFGGWRSLKAVQRYLHVQTQHLNECVDALEKAESTTSTDAPRLRVVG